jgi:tetratricopeptide (TPR) repeat protein
MTGVPIGAVRGRLRAATTPDLAQAIRQGRLRDAERLCRSILESEPDRVDVHHNLGNVLCALRRPREAIVCYEKALAIDPDHVEAHNNLGKVLSALDRVEQAVPHFERALALRPHIGGLHSNLGNAVRQLGRLEDAVVHCRDAVAAAPDSAEAHCNLGIALQALDRSDEAIAHYRKALAFRPAFAQAHHNLGEVLLVLGRCQEALPHCERAVALMPGSAEAHCNLGCAVQALGRPQEAIAHYQQALAIRPDLARAHNRLGTAWEVLDRLDLARAAHARAVELAPRNADFQLAFAHVRTFPAGDPHLVALERLGHDIASFSETEQMSLHFALGKALADAGQRNRSFRHIAAGNALKRRRVDYDEPATLRQFERIRQVFTADLMRQKRGGGDPSPAPVFVVGMPRSGSTLIEQILASHSGVFGAGELDDFNQVVASRGGPDGAATYPEVAAALSGGELRRLGADYLGRVRAAAPDAERIVDKMPLNFRYVGLIHLALPRARIIHTRRDPVDTCLSCFSILFAGDQPYSYDLAELGRYHAGYRALMQHWRRVLPDGVMLEVDYEDVVDDLEGQARRIVAHCGLDWQDACLAFHRTQRAVRTASVLQVRQPIYRGSVGRWRPYAHLLQPLLAALEIAPLDERSA